MYQLLFRKAFAVTLLTAIIWSAAGPAGSSAKAQESSKKKAEDNTASLAERLIGAWVFVGRPGDVGEPSEAGVRLKFYTGKNWCITHADSETGIVQFHHGGTYVLDGETLTCTHEYANESTVSLLKKTMRFKIKVDGDSYTQLGLDNPYSEVWKRVK